MPHPDPDYLALFRDYSAAYQASLGDHVEADRIRAFFAENFLALPIAGGAQPGANDLSFAETLDQGYAFYKAIGTVGMATERVAVTPVAENHDSVQVFYRATYRRKTGEEITIPFDVTYLLQRRPDGPKIFAFIAGDEMGLYQQHGLVDADGKPV